MLVSVVMPIQEHYLFVLGECKTSTEIARHGKKQSNLNLLCILQWAMENIVMLHSYARMYTSAREDDCTNERNSRY